MSKPWPPPPDLDSLKELVATADVEGFLADGAPGDEYDTEAKELHDLIGTWPSVELTHENLLPALTGIWKGAFSLDDQTLASRRAGLEGLAGQIAHFFGPEAQPRVRGS